MAKVLFLTNPKEDYLDDSMLYGFRQILSGNCIDLPKKESMYTDHAAETPLYGNGFTIWKLLPNIAVDRERIESRIAHGEFDVIVIGSIARQFHSKRAAILEKIKAAIASRTRLIFLDGEDSPNLRREQIFGMLGLYLKRESLIRTSLLSRPTAFSIPTARVVYSLDTHKRFLFSKHVQCDEAYKLVYVQQNCQKSYAFTKELDYRRNLAESFLAVTMKKTGWDCMRHYEIAGSGCVMAFYRLEEKPARCAPFGLVDMQNAISFTTASELKAKIELVFRENRYRTLQENSYRWALNNTCENRARLLLNYVT